MFKYLLTIFVFLTACYASRASDTELIIALAKFSYLNREVPTELPVVKKDIVKEYKAARKKAIQEDKKLIICISSEIPDLKIKDYIIFTVTIAEWQEIANEVHKVYVVGIPDGKGNINREDFYSKQEVENFLNPRISEGNPVYVVPYNNGNCSGGG